MNQMNSYNSEVWDGDDRSIFVVCSDHESFRRCQKKVELDNVWQVFLKHEESDVDFLVTCPTCEGSLWGWKKQESSHVWNIQTVLVACFGSLREDFTASYNLVILH